MPDFSPYLVAHNETIGDSCSSSEYNLILPPARSADHEESTNAVSKTIIYALEFMLMIIMVPITACQRVYQNDHLMVMMRVVLEVSLELIMWLVLAGVSILTSAALIFEDLYCGKSGSEGYRRLVKNCTDERVRSDDISHPSSHSSAENKAENSSCEENKRTEETAVKPRAAYRNRISSTYQQDKVHNPEENISAVDSDAPEKDEDSVNFSFYKPFRPRSMTEDRKNLTPIVTQSTDNRCARKSQ